MLLLTLLQYVSISMFTFFRVYNFIIMLYFFRVCFLVFKQDVLSIIWIHLFYCYLYLFIICDNKYPIRKKHSQRENNNINTIMQNVILICILNNFIELESLELQVYFDICLIHLLNNQAMLKQLCYQKKWLVLSYS